MKIVFVFPGISEAGFSRIKRYAEHGWINHGLCQLSACAKKAGHEVHLIDLRDLSGWDDYRKDIIDYSPDVVAITMMSVDFDYAVEAARIAKAVMPEVKTIVGGPHPSIMPEELTPIKDIDHIVIGEGEISFIKLVNDIENGRHREKTIIGEKPDLDELPFADRELFGFKETPIEKFLRSPFITIIAGRGCIYNCSFCQPAERKIFGNKVRRRSVDNVMKELNELRDKYDFQSLMFHDDCLTEDKAWVMEFCDKYRKNSFKKPFVCQSRADIICKNEDMVQLMKKTGLAMFLVGFESGNNRILKFLRKGTTAETNYKAAKMCKKYGIRIWANYMLGIPTETKEEVADTVNMIRTIKPYRPSPSFFAPHPGTDLYDYCVKNGIFSMKSHEDYSHSPNAPKIKGVDYEFLQKAVGLSKKRFLTVRLYRKIDFIIEIRIKGFLRKCRECLRIRN
jgi:anaerobic magnesium-protoporphyrin IX monomethyl ester cyclase